MISRYKGRRILLRAQDIYGRGKVPEGEEDYLFQYIIDSINEDCKTAVLKYEEKSITNGGDQFTNYPDITGDESSIPNYYLNTFKEDHELYNVHNGRVNKILNDEKDALRKQQRKERANAIDDVTDLEDRISEGTAAYKLLVAEFAPCGEFRVHTISKGQNQGRKVRKQKWSKSLICCIFCLTLHTTTHLMIHYSHLHHRTQSINIPIMNLSGTARLERRRKEGRRRKRMTMMIL
jgi:hypothetical protein